MHIRYVPRERPPFSALTFPTGAYHFFCRTGDHHFQTYSTFKPFIAAHGQLTAASLNALRSGQRPGVIAAGQNASQTRPTIAYKVSSGAPVFTFELAPEPRIFTLELAPELPFSLRRGTYTYQNMVGVPPPPPGGGAKCVRSSDVNVSLFEFLRDDAYGWNILSH